MGNRIFDILNKIVYNTLLALYQPVVDLINYQNTDLLACL